MLKVSKEGASVPDCLTSGVAAVGVHEGVGHPLILLQGALLRHAAVHRAQLPAFLLPVGHGGLVDGHLLSAVERQAERWEDRKPSRGQKQKEGQHSGGEE